MILAAALSLTDILHHPPPGQRRSWRPNSSLAWALVCSFAAWTLHELRKDVAAGAAFAVILAVLATGFTLAAHRLGGAPILDAFLSFAPGGQAEMTVLAIVVGADLGFVVIHHLMRLVVVITGAPIVARLIWGKSA